VFIRLCYAESIWCVRNSCHNRSVVSEETHQIYYYPLQIMVSLLREQSWSHQLPPWTLPYWH